MKSDQAVSMAIPTEKKMNELRAMITEILERCISMEMETPFIMWGVSPNGSRIAIRVEGDGTPGEVLAEHYENPGALPMTIVVADQRNDAVRVTITASGQKTWH